MAKKPVKPASKPEAKKTSTATKSNASSTDLIEKSCLQALKTLQALGVEQQLQQDIEWCLGSYRHDKNPAGLYEMAERSLVALQDAKARKAKGVTAKVIGDIEKALQSR